MVIVSLSTKLLYWNRMRLQLIKQLDDISTLQMGLGQVLEPGGRRDEPEIGDIGGNPEGQVLRAGLLPEVHL